MVAGLAGICNTITDDSIPTVQIPVNRFFIRSQLYYILLQTILYFLFLIKNDSFAYWHLKNPDKVVHL